MNKPGKKMFVTVTLIIVVFFALIAAGMAALYYFGDKLPDPGLTKSLRDEYSVHIDVRTVTTPGGDVLYIVPGQVRWDQEHKRLLYNLSNQKEAALAFVETLSGRDEQALDILMAQTTKDYWVRKGYTGAQIIEAYRSNHMDIDKPYLFGLEKGEDDPSEGMISVVLKSIDGETRFELSRQPDGTWKI